MFPTSGRSRSGEMRSSDLPRSARALSESDSGNSEGPLQPISSLTLRSADSFCPSGASGPEREMAAVDRRYQAKGPVWRERRLRLQRADEVRSSFDDDRAWRRGAARHREKVPLDDRARTRVARPSSAGPEDRTASASTMDWERPRGARSRPPAPEHRSRTVELPCHQPVMWRRGARLRSRRATDSWSATRGVDG